MKPHEGLCLGCYSPSRRRWEQPMSLSFKQGKAFFDLINSIIAFSARRFDLCSEDEAARFALYCDDDLLRREALRSFWEDPTALDDMIATQNTSLGPKQRAALKRFSHRYSGPSLLVGFDFDGRALMTVGDSTVAVSSLAKDLTSMLEGRIPRIIDVTLLPFEDLIVYDSSIAEYPVAMGPGMKKALEEEGSAALGRVPVTDANEFCELADRASAKKAADDEKRFADGLKRAEWDRMGNEPMVPGVHRGVLAGLSEEERAAKVEKKLSSLETDPVYREDLVARMGKEACGKEQVTSLEESLMLSNKEAIANYARTLQIAGASKLRKAELAKRVADCLLSSSEYLTRDLEDADEAEFKTVMELVGSELGVIEFSKEDVMVSGRKYFPFIPWARMYRHDGDFCVAMPEDVRRLIGSIDMGGVERMRLLRKRVGHFAETLTELCGVVPVVDFCERLRSFYGFQPADHEIISALVSIIRKSGEDISYSVWYDPRKNPDDAPLYLVDYRLSDSYLTSIVARRYAQEMKEKNCAVDVFSDASMKKIHELVVKRLDARDEFVLYLLDCHEGKASQGPCPIDPALAEGDVTSWKAGLPAAVNLRNWLDAHVPDGEDDYFFADDCVDELIDVHADSVRPTDLIDAASDMDLFTLSEDPEGLISRLMAFDNAMPRWENNGWSADALHSKITGKRIFRNPDGTEMKVGRNDPCPCGSGKKYKKCCGR